MKDSLIGEACSLESLVGRLADEFLRRQEAGERPDVEEYVARYPQAADVLRNVLAARRPPGGAGTRRPAGPPATPANTLPRPASPS